MWFETFILFVTGLLLGAYITGVVVNRLWESRTQALEATKREAFLVLEFYADEEVWIEEDDCRYCGIGYSAARDDQGARAKKMLEKHGHKRERRL